MVPELGVIEGFFGRPWSHEDRKQVLTRLVGDAPGPPSGRRRGLYHIGIKVGDSLDELRAAKRELESAGVPIDGMSDHTVSQSLYLRDPDGNEVELYDPGRRRGDVEKQSGGRSVEINPLVL